MPLFVIMKIMVCGSIGYGDVEKIRCMYKKLHLEGFEILNHIEKKGMDYSNIKDFRDKKEISSKIVEHDFEYIASSDVLVVLANGKPSYGTGIEMYVAKKNGKKIILLAQEPLPTPWLVNFSDFIASDETELFVRLHDIENNL